MVCTSSSCSSCDRAGQVEHPGQFSTRITPFFWSIFSERQHTKAEPGEYVFAYRGQPDRVSDWVSVRTAEAIQTPVEQSVARAQALQREQGMEAQQVQAQQRSEAQVRTMG
jgi:hypothetical protein